MACGRLLYRMPCQGRSFLWIKVYLLFYFFFLLFILLFFFFFYSYQFTLFKILPCLLDYILSDRSLSVAGSSEIVAGRGGDFGQSRIGLLEASKTLETDSLALWEILPNYSDNSFYKLFLKIILQTVWTGACAVFGPLYSCITNDTRYMIEWRWESDGRNNYVTSDADQTKQAVLDEMENGERREERRRRGETRWSDRPRFYMGDGAVITVRQFSMHVLCHGSADWLILSICLLWLLIQWINIDF